MDNNINMSENDKFLYYLLDIQEAAVQLVLFADLLSYEVALEGKDIILSRYYNTGNSIKDSDIDVLVLKSLYIYAIARVMFFYVAIQRYNYLSNLKQQGEWQYSLEPNILININNIFSLIALVLGIDASWEVYSRDIAVPVFGIR
ncbi:hypothetical protein SAMN04487886_101111 [Clostridium sp. DSM 8431]|nr:hypothetical protein SAMN04487886_101111 [Clostridium sp. DSM 8431]